MFVRLCTIAAVIIILLAGPAFAGDVERGRTLAVATGCAECHGSGGISTDPTVPNLAGQMEDYLSLQLRRFREPPTTERTASWAPHRADHTMNAKAGLLSVRDIDDLAAYYAALPCGERTDGSEPAAGGPAAACLWCHETEDKRRQNACATPVRSEARLSRPPASPAPRLGAGPSRPRKRARPPRYEPASRAVDRP